MLILLVLVFPGRALAWGREGHRIICGIAWHRLTPEARALAAHLLGEADERAFVDACYWADQIRPERPETGPLHYVNIPPGVPGVDLARDCGDTTRHCVIWAIVHYARRLADSTTGPAERADALRFVLHFVGDVHQPLHAGRLADLGGNHISVHFFGNERAPQGRTNLHTVWDSEILRHAGQMWPSAAEVLNAEVTSEQARAWRSLDVIAWANESYRLCEDFVYARLPEGGRIGDVYYRQALAYTDVQLQKAGVRLAFLLNRLAAGTLNLDLPAS